MNPQTPGLGREHVLEMLRTGRKVLLPKKSVIPPVWVNKAQGDASTSQYVGSQVCGQCHSDKYESFRRTAHHRTSREPGRDSISGRFDAGQNILRTKDSNLYFLMKAGKDGFYQSVFAKYDAQFYTHRQRIDIVVGSGNHGQSYLYWDGNYLFQLPISYFREINRWVYSPAYWDGTADFARPVTARCLECHATYFEEIVGTINGYHKKNYVLGVACERCHGLGSAHARDHQNQAKEATRMVQPGRLSRDRQLELCAQCHSGTGRRLQPSFSYQPGQPLKQYILLDHQDGRLKGGVHTDDQLARLSLSRCFQKSSTLTCITCHNPHDHERGNLARFSARCRQCHQPDQCQVASHQEGNATSRHCVDCHMPSRRDSHTQMQTAGSVVSPEIRDHFIVRRPEVRASH